MQSNKQLAFEVVFYLVPALLIVIGIYMFVRFIPGHAALLSVVWVIVISVIYVKYNKWY